MDKFKWTLSRLYRDFVVLTTKINSNQYGTLGRLYRDFVVLTTKVKLKSTQGVYLDFMWTLSRLYKNWQSLPPKLKL